MYENVTERRSWRLVFTQLPAVPNLVHLTRPLRKDVFKIALADWALVVSVGEITRHDESPP